MVDYSKWKDIEVGFYIIKYVQVLIFLQMICFLYILFDVFKNLKFLTSYKIWKVNDVFIIPTFETIEYLSGNYIFNLKLD